MKKIIATSVLAAALIGFGGTAAHADTAPTTDPADSADTSVSTDATDGGIVSDNGTVVTVGDVPISNHPGTIDSPNGLCEGGVVSRKATETLTNFTIATGRDSTVSGDSGVTLTISRSTTFGVTGTISSTTSVSASDVITTVKEDVGVSVAATKSGTSSTSGAWKVPSAWKRGQLQIGAIKHKGSVQKYVENKACKKVASGTAATYNIPETGWYFHHVKLG